jgi:surfactin synthase thioesterase subunit
MSASPALDEFNHWFPAYKADKIATPRLRLICFPSAGTMESLYTATIRGEDRKTAPNVLIAWAEKHEVEVFAVQLPGRGKRHAEPFAGTLAEVGETLARLLTPKLAGAPFAVVGHSMGCWAAYELIIRLHANGWSEFSTKLAKPTTLHLTCLYAPNLRPRPCYDGGCMLPVS